MVLCPHSGYPSCLSSPLLGQQTPFLQKEWRSWLWVTLLGTNWKHVHTGTQCLLSCPSTRSQPCTQAPEPCPNYSAGTLKKGVFTLVTSKYRNWAPVPGNQVWTHLKCAHIYLPCLGQNFKKMRSTQSRESLFFSFASIPSRLKRAKGRAWAMSTKDSDFTTLLMLLFFHCLVIILQYLVQKWKFILWEKLSAAILLITF